MVLVAADFLELKAKIQEAFKEKLLEHCKEFGTQLTVDEIVGCLDSLKNSIILMHTDIEEMTKFQQRNESFQREKQEKQGRHIPVG